MVCRTDKHDKHETSAKRIHEMGENAHMFQERSPMESCQFLPFCTTVLNSVCVDLWEISMGEYGGGPTKIEVYVGFYAD